ncbi:hypothetical protein ACFO3D_15615 [Virgibacillus kekensis]|uniref:Uncharacterized protein n=1 Tax=Virgibacillus kekensis TaxID=202261 RepID=A0ABV9DNP9_9BACI
MGKLVYIISGILMVCLSLLTGAIIVQIAKVNNSSLSGISVSLVLLVFVIGISLVVASSINEPKDN